MLDNVSGSGKIVLGVVVVLCFVWLIMSFVTLGGDARMCPDSKAIDPLVYMLLLIVTVMGFFLYKGNVSSYYVNRPSP